MSPDSMSHVDEPNFPDRHFEAAVSPDSMSHVDEPNFPERLAWWFGAQVLFALVPLLAVMLRVRDGGWTASVGHGELVLVAVVITAGASATAARVQPRSQRRRTRRAALVSVGLVVATLGGLVYGNLSSLSADDAHANIVYTARVSGTFFVLSLLIGTAATYLEHVEEKVARSS